MRLTYQAFVNKLANLANVGLVGRLDPINLFVLLVFIFFNKCSETFCILDEKLSSCSTWTFLLIYS